MTITSKMPAQLPSQARPDTLDVDTENVFAALPAIVAEMDATAASMNAYSAGTAYAIPYTFDATTTDADPGAGKIRFDNATQSSTTTLRLDLVGSNGVDYTPLLDSFDASTSAVKGQLRIEKAADPTKFIAFNVTGRAAPAGYRNIAVSYVGISGANPFATGDALILKFQRTGDKGDTPSLVTGVLHLRDEKPTNSVGGTSTGGVNTRTLNTTRRNTISGATVSGNQWTLPAGTYRMQANAPCCGAARHQAYIYNVTDAVAYVGGSEFASSSAQTRSFVAPVEVVLTAAKTFELRHYVAPAATTNDLGIGASVTGLVEVFSEVFVEKLS
ncbi:hypothetical protein NX774_12255 [Massilia agilis]|uniref:Uncharacterized protein n=1 Tax=Massilia agilis TaxID=1811226 RepID=A0ABT2DBJ1_9BURK|nr:hypothetical protein [Massilia agilis]MCS0808693.1 hypothetical protein [Massilia agilis]